MTEKYVALLKKNNMKNKIKIETVDFNRKQIDKIDQKIFTLIEERMDYVKKIGKIKKEKKLKIIDPKREEEIIEKHSKRTTLKKEFIKNFYQLIFTESHKKQK